MIENNEHNSKLNYVLVVLKDKGQIIVDELKEKGIYDNSRSIISIDDKLWIPIKEKIAKAQIKVLPEKKRLMSLKNKFGLRSFDIIGEIIVIFIPNFMDSKKKEIGKYLMTLYPKIKAVYSETTKAEGIFRIQLKELIAGEGSETIHIENKLKFKLDITKVFFSPRQITERMELIRYIPDNSNVCVLFSGIGPIPIYLAKFTKATKIIGIELNTIAHKFSCENLLLNKIQNVQLINGDVRTILPELAQKILFDIIVMPEPKDTKNFVKYTIKALKKEGLLISYITSSEMELENKLSELTEIGFSIEQIKRSLEIAPKIWRFIIISKKIKR
ncbi:MAG: hypothetical protein FK730_02510 [Asgard group archaeon]|nr:hypothetical protein [Asgard group archaeon]